MIHPLSHANVNHKHYRRKRPPIAANWQSNYNHHHHHHHYHHLLMKSPNLVKMAGWSVVFISLLMAHVSYADYLLANHSLENLHINELTPVGSIVHQLKAIDRSKEKGKITFALTGDFFSVDEETGEVRLMKSLDREREPQIRTVVNVLSSNSDQPLESRLRSITIDDADDSWPVFQAHKRQLINNPQTGEFVFQVEVSEQAPTGTILLAEMLVTDADEGVNAEIVFECRQRLSSLSACDHFSIESRRIQSGRYSVTLKTKHVLDYERIQSYKFSLIARGRRSSPLKGTPLEAEAIINIHLTNVQDEGPVFVNAPYSLSMEEGLESNKQLLKLIVQDGDLAPQRELSVIVIDEMFRDYFTIVQDSELNKVFYLITKKIIDREDPLFSSTGNMFTLNLLAVELNGSGEPVASQAELDAAYWNHSTYNGAVLRRETVSVLLLDMPDTAPRFVHSTSGRPIERNFLIVNVSESLVNGSSVPNLDLTVLDLDEGANSRFTLSLVDGEMGPRASEAFMLESELVQGKSEVVLNVRNASLLDHEDPSRRVYRFSVLASKSTTKALILSERIDIQLNIMDANDNWPKFERDQYVVSVPEGSPPGYVVATIRANDRDSANFGRLSYILFGHGASNFKVISSEGKIVVGDCATPECLDHEKEATYSLTYEARDGGGHTGNVSVIINVIDVNDHPPKFLESVYKRELISDNLSSKQNYISPQLIVRARDEDGPLQGRNNITYRISSSNLTGLEVEPSSGLVYISQPLDLDIVLASMQQTMGSSASYRKITFEAQVVADDNGTPPLNSSATILLTVKGNRDGAPQFKQDTYFAYVSENQPIAKPFFQVQALDPDDKDSQLRYSLGDDLNDLIHIEPSSGQLSFKSRVDADDFKGVRYNITVYASDNSKPYPLRASAVVSILIQDLNNKKPKFEQKEYTALLVQGKTKPGNVILQVKAIDLDQNSRLNYSIMLDQIVINDRNGQEFTLNDIANSTAGYLSHIGTPERIKLVKDFKRLFNINQRTGAIELKSEPDYSFAASLSLPVRVVDLAQEVYTQPGDLQEDLAYCNIFLQSHIDRSPIFAPPWSMERRDYTISILEEQPLETTIFSLLAKEPQTNNGIDTFEKVPESDPRDYFRVERSGLVTIGRRIDYEELPQPKRLSLTVKALARAGAFSTANLIVQIVDLNDNAPQFKNQSYHAAVSESISSSHDIVTIRADDRDSAEYGQVHYSLAGFSSDLFTIHPRKGVVNLKKGARLDRDLESNYYLVGIASDCNETSATGNRQAFSASEPALGQTVAPVQQSSFGCRRTSVPIEITVLDENDNDPVFLEVNKRGEFEATISETASIGTVITQTIAKDIDEGPNGQVSYEIVRTDERVNKLFKIDSEGYISAISSLSGLGRSTPYKISVRAYDAGKQSRQAYAVLLLTITDVVANDGVPKFIRPKPDEVVALPESAGPSTFVYQVQAVDPDEEANGRLMYKFIQPSEVFEIDPFEGVIKTQHWQNFHLDRERAPNYTLIIVAHDLGSPPKQAHQVLTIKITDINDNEPQFERQIDDPPLLLSVDEEAPKDTLIGSIQAIDRDVGQNALVGYEIIEGNQDGLFRLSWDTNPMNSSAMINDQYSGNNPCFIYSTGRLDRETRESYTLTIKATSMWKLRNQLMPLHDPLGGRNPFNQYNASDLSKIRLTIKLADINDNKPTFVQQNAKSVVDSSAEVYSQLMVLQATDADSSSSPIQYSILDAFYYSDSKFKPHDDIESNKINYERKDYIYSSMKYVFHIHPKAGILRNSVSLRPFTDGYFEIYIKADSGSGASQQSGSDANSSPPQMTARGGPSQSVAAQNKCQDTQSNASTIALPSGLEVSENCHVAVTKVVVFVTHQRETFRFVFNKSRLNDRIDEFKDKIQQALETIMFEPAQASIGDSRSPVELSNSPGRVERIYLNTFNTDFYEREDGSLDFSTITSCSQLVKFDDRSYSNGRHNQDLQEIQTIVPNQVVNYEDVLNLLKTLNATQSRQQKPSLFSQYGLVKIERCLPDKTMYKMTLPERLALYFAAMIALVSILLAFIVSKMRKNYERKLKLLQRSKYQYMGSPYA